jgi:hypothetical protein
MSEAQIGIAPSSPVGQYRWTYALVPFLRCGVFNGYSWVKRMFRGTRPVLAEAALRDNVTQREGRILLAWRCGLYRPAGGDIRGVCRT